MDEVTAGAALIGIVNAVKAQFPQVSGIYAICLAVVLGAIAGYLGLLDLTVQSGIVTGLASSGVYTIAKRAGGN